MTRLNLSPRSSGREGIIPSLHRRLSASEPHLLRGILRDPAKAKGHKKSASQVSFEDVSIRSYSQSLGDNPSRQKGTPPISLGWDYEESETISVDEHYAKRVIEPKEPRRLPKSERYEILVHANCTLHQINKAIEEADSVDSFAKNSRQGIQKLKRKDDFQFFMIRVKEGVQKLFRPQAFKHFSFHK